MTGITKALLGTTSVVVLAAVAYRFWRPSTAAVDMGFVPMPEYTPRSIETKLESLELDPRAAVYFRTAAAAAVMKELQGYKLAWADPSGQGFADTNGGYRARLVKDSSAAVPASVAMAHAAEAGYDVLLDDRGPLDNRLVVMVPRSASLAYLKHPRQSLDGCTVAMLIQGASEGSLVLPKVVAGWKR